VGNEVKDFECKLSVFFPKKSDGLIQEFGRFPEKVETHQQANEE